ncbi:MAG TPA: ATP synthase subunit C, partial [Spirochaetota bacterium]
RNSMKKIRIFNMLLLVLSFLFAAIATVFVYAEQTGSAAVPATQSVPPLPMGIGFFSAALSVGISCIGAGIAVKGVGSAAMGAIAEKPELTGRALIFVGLAEGIAIYGLIVAIMILGKIV